jgi:hypothetical protein
MQFPIVQQYKTDITGTNPDNQILDEPKHIEAGEWTRIIVPLHAPFFVDSLVIHTLDGSPLTLNKDYRIFRLMSRLTELCATPVACMIELIDLMITDVLMDYKVVGEFSLIDTDMLQLITSAVINDRPVLWDNLKDKPVVFPPVLHSHSLITDIVAWQDVIECMDLFLAMQTANGKNPFQVRIDHYHDLVTSYIDVYSDMLTTFLNNHVGTYNAHGLTATQMGKELVDNFATATSSNVLQGRSDMHLTPVSLETVIDTCVSCQGDYLEASKLPVSSFVNPGFNLTVSGWNLIAANPVNVLFQGKSYTIPAGVISLVLGGLSPSNSTFYVYVILSGTTAQYMVTTQKTMETVSQIWVATAVTTGNSIGSVTCFNNVFLLNGYRISEVKMGNAIPAASGPINTTGVCPWIHHGGPTVPLILTVPATVHSNVAGNTLTVNGSTVGNGATLTYSITQSGGAALIFSKTTGIAANEVVTFTSPTVLTDTPIVISAVAVDSLGGISDAKTATITVFNHASPTVPTTLTVPATVKFSSTGNFLAIAGSTSSDGSTLTYSLTQSGDSSVTFSKTSGIAAGEQVTFTAPNVTVNTPIVISVVAVDSLGFVSAPVTATTTILCHVAPTAPVVATPATVHILTDNNILTISGSTASDGATLTYSLTQTGNTALVFSKTTGIAAGEQVTFSTGNVTVDTPVSISVVATDSLGLVSSATVVTTTVLHHFAPTAPVITVPATVYMTSINNILTISGSTASDGATLTYSLTQTGGSTLIFNKTTGIAAGEQVNFSTMSVSANTTISISAVATDSMGFVSNPQTVTTTILKHVGPTPPTVLTVPASVSQNSTGNVLTVSGAVASDGAGLTYSITQSGGAAVTFSKVRGIKEGEVVTFTTPAVSSNMDITISAVAVDSFGFTSTAISAITTITAFPTQAGTPYGGGYYIGNFETGGHTYALIDAGAAADGVAFLSNANAGSSDGNLSWTYTPPVTDSYNGLVDTVAIQTFTNQINSNTQFQMDGLAPALCLAWRGGGFTDWYLPSLYEQSELYRVLGSGTTTVAAYKPGGGQTLQNNPYWTSTLLIPSGASSSSGWVTSFVDGSVIEVYMEQPSINYRPMRRVQIS